MSTQRQSSVSIATSNRGRRVFRGRGGANDGHIPHFLSHRRKPRTSIIDTTAVEPFPIGDGVVENDVGREREITSSHGNCSEGMGPTHHRVEGILQSPPPPLVRDYQEFPSPKDVDEAEQEIINELKHLRKRIRNIQESIQLSSNALCSPPTWESNCLNAVKNCVGEWRAIVAFHGKNIKNDCNNGDTKCNNINNDENEEIKEITEYHCMDQHSEWSKSTSLQVFGLVQMAMQSGPLVGSKPGYFKRCGAEVAKTAQSFLVETVGGDVIEELRFTERQHSAIAKWILDAEKAVEKGAQPSKSALKLQRKGAAGGKNTKKGKKKT